ncbi:sucrose transport protein SUT1-like [Asparagus officinalis]|uniref:sucrose transport protein SUT1-like n=1 Tax=Asparagus officinalis TaxID=4686 RepID=UPI00098DFF56|nr:sucrose transport protein SUT1-like [Asparagus officinalis]
MVYIWVEEGSKALRLYDPQHGRIHVSRDVMFEEGKEWEWSADGVERSPNWVVFAAEGETAATGTTAGAFPAVQIRQQTNRTAAAVPGQPAGRTAPAGTPTLELSHALSSLMLLCGPIAGFIVQPCVGFYSDKCQSRFGRRRPFILVGCLFICLAVIVIGFSSDIGYALGDTKEDCSVYHGPRRKAAVIFVGGFWVLDFANNAVQGPARALMADLSGRFGYNATNAIFAFWMAFGNILGYASGSTGEWHNWLPFLNTSACCDACANLKGAFLVAVVFLLLSMLVTLIVAKEVPLSSIPGKGEEEHRAEFLDIFRSIKNLPPGMPSVLLITGLTWVRERSISTVQADNIM